MNKLIKKRILLLAGVVGVVIGVMLSVPSMMKENYLAAAFSTLVLITGLILIAIGFGD